MSAGPEPADQEPADQPAVVVAGDALVDLTPRPQGRWCRGLPAAPGRLLPLRRRRSRPTPSPHGTARAQLRRPLRRSPTRTSRHPAPGSPMRCPHPTPPLSPPCICARTGRPPTPSTRTAPPTGACASNTSLLSRTAARCPRGRLCTSGRWVCCSNPLASTLDGLSPREAGRRLVSLDRNVRPGLVTDRAACLRRFAEWWRSPTW